MKRNASGKRFKKKAKVAIAPGTFASMRNSSKVPSYVAMHGGARVNSMKMGQVAGDQQSMASNAHALTVLRRSIYSLSKHTEPEVAQTRLTLIGLVMAVIGIAVLQLVWLSSAVKRLADLTGALADAGRRYLAF